MAKCPNCGSIDVEEVKLLGDHYSLHCNSCGYDEFEDENSSGGKKKKSRNVYRTGGGRRSVKK